MISTEEKSDVSPLDWTEEQALNSGDEAVECMLSSIRSAKSKVDLEVYIFTQDVCGDWFSDALSKAAQRGVQVRLLVDGIGSFGFSPVYFEQMRKAGVAVRIYHPTPFDMTPNALLWKMPLKGYLRYLGRMNKRNHRKVLIVDDAVVVVGSVNITRCHLSKSKGGDDWRDAAVRVNGPAIKYFSMAFERSWKYANRIAFSQAPDAPLVPVMFNFSKKLRGLKYLLLLEMIYRADHRLWLTNAYFVPDGSMLKALRFAAWTGVDVKIIVPRQSDVFFIRMVSSAFYLGLLSAGVRIFEYLPSILHAKTMVIDEFGVVGTSNLNHRSLLHDLEVDVVLKHKKTVDSLSTAFLTDLKNCQEVTIREWEKRPWFERIAGNLILYMRYWL